MFPDGIGSWFAVRDGDPRALALYLRHYSAEKSRGTRARGYLKGNHARFVGNGEHVVLLTLDCRALFAWRVQEFRKDGQVGVECCVFRNESDSLSSALILEAVDIARRRWPGRRLFTYVWDSKVRSVNPGYCFKAASRRPCGRSADGSKSILELAA